MTKKRNNSSIVPPVEGTYSLNKIRGGEGCISVQFVSEKGGHDGGKNEDLRQQNSSNRESKDKKQENKNMGDVMKNEGKILDALDRANRLIGMIPVFQQNK